MDLPIDKKEVRHVLQVLELAKQSIIKKDAFTLKELSNQTIHCSCTFQDTGSIDLAILIYSLSKLIERSDDQRIKNWPKLVDNISKIFDLAAHSLKNNNYKKYEKRLETALDMLKSSSVNLKPYIEEVIRKASINKASKIYEHGISLGQTSKLLGITQWELSEYTGQRSKIDDVPHGKAIDQKSWAKMTLEFFS